MGYFHNESFVPQGSQQKDKKNGTGSYQGIKRKQIPQNLNPDGTGGNTVYGGEEDPAEQEERAAEMATAIAGGTPDTIEADTESEYEEESAQGEAASVKTTDGSKNKIFDKLSKNKMNANQGKNKLIRKVLKKVADALIKLIISHPVIFGVIFAVVVIIALMAFAFDEDDNNGDENNYRENLQTQDMTNEREFQHRKESYKDWIAKEVTLGVAYAAMTLDSDFRKLKRDILESQTEVFGDDNDTMASYDKEAGYQILSDEGVLLNLLEQISYARNYTDWEPYYDYDGSLDERYYAAKDEWEQYKDTDHWTEMERRRKLEEFKELEEEYNSLTDSVKRYEEMNLKYKEKIDKQFVNSSKEAKVHPDGKPVENKVEAYFKDRYGVSTGEVMKELTYYHTIMERTMKYQKTITGTTTTEINQWLEDPKFEDTEFVTESDRGIDLSYVEFPFRARLEIVHHEVTLDGINNDGSLNNIFENADVRKKIKKSLAYHIPIFEYATYSSKVAGKTFYNYELYDEEYFNEEGRYIYDTNFDKKIKNYTENPECSLDFSIVQQVQIWTTKRNMLKEQLQNVEDPIAAQEIQEEIDRLAEELGHHPNQSQSYAAYVESYQNFLNMFIALDNENRPYDPHNHNIFKDEDEEYYIAYAKVPDKKILSDAYTEEVTVTETKKAGGAGQAQGTVTYGPWQPSGTNMDGSCTTEVKSEIKSLIKQSSLKPVKVRSVLNSADYEYEKEEERVTNVDEMLAEARNSSHWEQREVFVAGQSAGYEYQKVSQISFTNWGKVTAEVEPWETNTNMQLDTKTYLEDFYGQTELLTEEYNYDNSPGSIGNHPGAGGGHEYQDPGERNYTPGYIDLPYYYQFNYPNDPYSISTVARSGCGPSCLAMCVSGMTSITVEPPEVALWAGDNGFYCIDEEGIGHGSYWSLIPRGAEHYGLTATGLKRSDKEGVVAALSAGYPVIEICGPGLFTRGGHFILLTGIDEQGNVRINDPGSKNRTYKITGQTYDIDTIMSNASTNQGLDAVTFWVIS